MKTPQNRREFIINSVKSLTGGFLLSSIPGVLIPGSIQDNPLSPAHWDEDEREHYWKLTNMVHYPKPIACSRKAIIVGTTGAFAIRAGMEAIYQGGNAMDAAITAALTQVALTAGGPTSYAGIMNCLYFDAKRNKVFTLDGGYNVPREETDPLTIPRWGTSSGRAVLIPGFMPGIEAAHQKFGKLPFSNLFDPAIYLAEEGFEMSSGFEQMIQSRRNILSRLQGTREIFSKPDGTFYRRGDQFSQPLLAKTLKKVAEYGADYMTSGDWAKKFCRVVRQAGGKVSLKDLNQYSPLWSEPHSTTYNGNEMFTSYGGRPGGVSLIESINLMELAKLGDVPHYTESPESFYWLTQIALMTMVLNFPNSDRFRQELPSLSLSVENRVTKKHAEVIWQKLSKPGWINGLIPNILTKGSHSDGIISIDKAGNIAILSHSINSAPWGHTGLFVEGVSIPDSGGFLQREIQWAGPGNRIWAGLNPHLIFKKRHPVLAGTSIGSSMHSTTLQRLSSVLDSKMDLAAAIEAPTFHGPYFENNYIKLGVQEGTFSEDLLKGVQKKGQHILLLEERDCWIHRGYWIGLSINSETGKRKGGTCWELNGYAIGI